MNNCYDVDNGGCEHECIHDDDTGLKKRCACREGYSLAADGYSCVGKANENCSYIVIILSSIRMYNKYNCYSLGSIVIYKSASSRLHLSIHSWTHIRLSSPNLYLVWHEDYSVYGPGTYCVSMPYPVQISMSALTRGEAANRGALTLKDLSSATARLDTV